MNIALSLKVSALIVGLALVGCKKQDKAGKGASASMSGKADLKTEDEKTYYAMGHTMGKRIERTEPSASEIGAFTAGFQDAATNAEPKVNVSEFQMKIGQMFRKRMSKRVDIEKDKGTKFLDSFVANEKGTKTASGLAYVVTSAGSDQKPKPEDVVRVKYKGTLIDGTEFDANDNATFPLNRVIRGWTEGLQLVGVGGSIKLVIPSDLAYGDVGSPPKIPGGATLVFEVTLHEIKPPAPQGKPEAAKPKKK